MAMAMASLAKDVTHRDMYLYDTYQGMPEPDDKLDRGLVSGEEAFSIFKQVKRDGDASDWCNAPLEEVKRNLARTGYPDERLHFVEGKVEETIPSVAPEKIAILRLDTDWYSSDEARARTSLSTLGGFRCVDH